MPHRNGPGRGWPRRPEDSSLIAPTLMTLEGSVAVSDGAPPAERGAPRPRAAAGRGWHRAPELLQAALVLTGLLLVFFWTPLTQRGGYYAPTDLLQGSELLRVGYLGSALTIAGAAYLMMAVVLVSVHRVVPHRKAGGRSEPAPLASSTAS